MTDRLRYVSRTRDDGAPLRRAPMRTPATSVRETWHDRGNPAVVASVGDRVFWAGDARHWRREGTIIGVYTAQRGGREELLIDIAWDLPAPGEPRAWAGVSRGFPVRCLDEAGWGWVDVPR